MRRDFTINRYKLLLEALLNQGFIFSSVHKFHRLYERRLCREVHGVSDRAIILRQDVDRMPKNSLAFALMQEELGIKSTFYFRIVDQSFDPRIIEEIARMGHDVGYHYEDVSLTANSSKFQVSSFKFREKDLIEESIVKFSANLEKLRKYADVKTICMHGSPMSRWDSRLLWKYYDYKDFGIEMEPYFDIDFSSMLYFTDTGRRWNGSGVSIRDKAEGGRQKAEGFSDGKAQSAERKEDRYSDWVRKPVMGSLMNRTEKSREFQERHNFRSTDDIIQAAERGELPDRIMMTFHPQRWTNHAIPWVKELLWQNTKNVGKYFLIKIRT